MKRREFLVSSVLGLAGAAVAAPSSPAPRHDLAVQPAASAGTRKILIAGGGYGTAFIRHMAQLTGKPRPKLCYLPTPSGDSPTGIINWYRACAPLNSRPKELTTVQGLGRLKGSHSPHYDREKDRRPLYHKLIGSGQMKPGYACDNDAGLYFEDNAVKRVVCTRAGAKCYYVSVVDGQVTEKVLEPDPIA